ncbi:IclR family transcriptional regulator [Cnuibacter sp. UC19_7]|uniref:IclR family transcriptional regulator n=1 Tax=Cnuibacter sp. UC19_7 TaxID=3350166 RepID=UPI0036728C0C
MQESPPEKTPSRLQTVERAVAFLEYVAAHELPTVRDVAVGLTLNLTTAYHLFNTLHYLGYLDRDADLRLRIGSRVSALNQAYSRGISLNRELVAIVEDLSKSTGETASASLLVGDSVVIQALSEGHQPVRAAGLYVGLSGSEHLRASGRLVLAFADPTRRSRILESALRNVTQEERVQIESRLNREAHVIRERGWSLDDGSYQPDISGVSAPILDSSNVVVGTINVSTPSSRFAQRQADVVAATVASAERATLLYSQGR